MSNGFCTPVLVHPRVSKIATDLIDLLQRLDQYAFELAEQLGRADTKLILLLGLNKSEFLSVKDLHFSHLRIVRVSNPTSNFINFGLRSKLALAKLGLAPTVLIAGDLTSGLLSSLVISRLSRRKIPIQASVHGELNTMAPSYLTRVKLNVKKVITDFSLPRVKSIRVVSNFLREELMSQHDLKDVNLFVAPVPISHYPTFVNRNSASLRIGVVGRLHYERNLLEVTEIIDLAISDEKVSEVKIIGEGPLRNYLEEWVEGHKFPQKIRLLGSQSQTEMLLHWSEIDVLLSCAVTEGYGLALREAVVSGAAVVARENLATRELQQIFTESVSLYRTPLEAARLLQSAPSKFELITKENTIEIQRDLDMQSISKLAKSWIRP
jgi:glycosyltransferase involved in cell wall biosynthesis